MRVIETEAKMWSKLVRAEILCDIIQREVTCEQRHFYENRETGMRHLCLNTSKTRYTAAKQERKLPASPQILFPETPQERDTMRAEIIAYMIYSEGPEYPEYVMHFFT